MNLLFPLVLLLAASAANAAEPITRVLHAGSAPIAEDAGADRRGVQGDEVLVFDSMSGSPQLYALLSAPRTYLGMALDLETDVGPDPLITRIVVYMVHNGEATQTYAGLRARVQLWDVWSENADPVFSAPTTLVEGTWTDFTVEQNMYYPLTLTPDPPIPLSGLASHGIAINFQGDSGGGFQDIDTLTSLLIADKVPLPVGSNALFGQVGYVDDIGQTDFNFSPANAFSAGWPTQALALKLYALDTLIPQEITDFAANPASPMVTDGSFTVSATGGASGQPVTFSVDASSAGVCTAGGTHGATLAIVNQGICLVHADQAGNATHRAAPRQSIPVQIGIGALVQDGGFEAGPSTPWLQGSTSFGSPLCDPSCSVSSPAPHDGQFWLWFGGAVGVQEVGFVQQTGTIASGARWLDFHLWWYSPVVAPPDPGALFDVTIDGATVFSLTPATAAAYSAGYTQASVDISAYADGQVHTLRFEGTFAAADGDASSVFVDDIGIRIVSDAVFLDGFEPQ